VFVGPKPIWDGILYDKPNEVGADRLVQRRRRFRKYGGPCVIVDFRHTINFDVVSRDGDYLGGAMPWAWSPPRSRSSVRTARLPLVEFRPRKP